MISDVSLVYDSGFLGKGVFPCDPFSLDDVNATVQDVMNAAANFIVRGRFCHGEGDKANLNAPIPFTATCEKAGSVLKYIFSALHVPIPNLASYNMSEMGWNLYINNTLKNTTMCDTFVQSNDHIRWLFEKK